jgi:hypothetical protein
MSPYKFLIYISYSYAIPIGTPLEKEILKRGYNVKWFSDLDEGEKALQHKTNVIHNIKDVITYNPDIILTATDSVPDFINALKVQVFHGFNAEKRPSKKNMFAHFRIRGFFDLYCTQGPNSTNGFKTQAKKQPHFEIIETGWSKVDPLFPLADINQSDTPTVMIASTFTERLSLAYNEDVYKEIERLSKTGNYNFIMVLHPKLPSRIVSKWKVLSNEYFKFYNTTDIIPLFKKADMMFADTTSAIQEFLLQKKPVVAFNHIFKHDYLIHVSEANQIEKAFNQALSYPSKLIQNIEKYIAELHPYFDGKSSKRIIDASISFLHEDKSHLKPKPFNFVRKLKMRKRLNHFTLKSYNKPYTIKQNNQ